jgi:hypothetical protein
MFSALSPVYSEPLHCITYVVGVHVVLLITTIIMIIFVTIYDFIYLSCVMMCYFLIIVV